MRKSLSLLAAAAIVAAGGGSAAGAEPTAHDGKALPQQVAAELTSLGITGQTTLDARVQVLVERALSDGLARARAAGVPTTGGAVVVLDLSRRAIAALASTPDHDRVRRAIPAGSVAKPFVALAALSVGIDPDEKIACPSRFDGPTATIRNWKGRDSGPHTLAEALSESCNTVFAAIGDRLFVDGTSGHHAIPRAFERAGFGIPTGLVPEEDGGSVPARIGTAGEAMLLAIGQGPLLVTPLQVARAYAGLAGVQPSGWSDIGGGPTPSITASLRAEPIHEGLAGAVRTGTASSAFAAADYTAAGKTGSAEIGDVTPYAWFAGYAPADDPAFVVAVVVERGRAGGLSAAPIARELFDALIQPAAPTGSLPVPPATSIALVVPLLAGIAAAPAGPLVGLVTGAVVAAASGGSLPAVSVWFALAGWAAGIAARRDPALAVVAVTLGVLGLPSADRGVAWILARWGVAALLATAVALAVMAVRARRAGPRLA